MDRYDVDSCIEILLSHVEDRDTAADILDQLETVMFNRDEELGCECCIGDEALYWKDDENNSFVDLKGEVLITVKDHIMRFKVKCCPNCGRKFE